MEKLYLHDLENNKMYPLSMFVNKEIICTKEGMMDTTALPEQFTLDIVFPPVEPRRLKNRLKTFLQIFKKWKGKIDKKTTTFENGCYFGLERRHKLDAIIESLKLNDVDYTERVKQPLFRGFDRRRQKDEVDATVYQHLEDNNE